MVNFEAAKALINSVELSDAQAQNVVHVLQLFLASPRNCTRFAAIRLLLNEAMLDQPAHAGIIATESIIDESRQSVAPLVSLFLNRECVDLLRPRLSAEACAAIDEGRPLPLSRKPYRLVIKTVTHESTFLQERWDIASKESIALLGSGLVRRVGSERARRGVENC